MYAVFSFTFYSKLKWGTFFLLSPSWNDNVHDLFLFPGCLVFSAVNFFQCLFWEFGDTSRQYPPRHNLSPHCLVLYIQTLVKKQIFLTGFELSGKFHFEITLNPLYVFFMIMFETVRRNFKLITSEAYWLRNRYMNRKIGCWSN